LKCAMLLVDFQAGLGVAGGSSGRKTYRAQKHGRLAG
jgi:hypothetical protein